MVMTRPTDNDVLLALLSLDAYSRGDNFAIQDLQEQIGHVDVLKTSTDFEEENKLPGAAGALIEAIFALNDVDTCFNGDANTPGLGPGATLTWQPTTTTG